MRARYFYLIIIIAMITSIGCKNKNKYPDVSKYKPVEKSLQKESIKTFEGLDKLVFKDLNNNEVPLSRYRGKVIIINIWRTWCEPCVGEIKGLNRLYREYKDKGLIIIGITSEEPEKVKECLKKDVKIEYPVYISTEEQELILYNYFKKSVLYPFSVLIDRSGNPRKCFVGYTPYTIFLKNAIKFLK